MTPEEWAVEAVKQFPVMPPPITAFPDATKFDPGVWMRLLMRELYEQQRIIGNIITLAIAAERAWSTSERSQTMADEWIQRLINRADDAVASGNATVAVDAPTLKRLASIVITGNKECDQCADVRGTLDKLSVGPGQTLAERVGLLASRTGARPTADTSGIDQDRTPPRGTTPPATLKERDLRG